MQKTLKKCRQCGTPIRVDRSVTSDDAVCHQCDPAQPAIDENPEPTPTNDRRMTGLGLRLSAVGLVLLTTGGLVLSMSPEHLRRVPGSILLQMGGALSTFLGLISISVGSLLCLFIPTGSRGRVPLLCSIAMLVVLTVLRLIDFTGFMRPSTNSLRIASTVVGIAWFVAWSVYIIRTAKAYNRDDLVFMIFLVLPGVGVCLSMIGYRLWQGELQSTDAIVQSVRLIVFCLGCLMGTLVYRLSHTLLDVDPRRLVGQPRSAKSKDSESSLRTS